MLQAIFGGLCMALADSVPGVSGGTVAFILGFYDRFIGAINDLVFGKWNEKKSALFYLLKLGIGFFLLGIILVAGITWLNGRVGGGSMDLSQFSIGLGLKLFFIGMIAISAMFLPGISGSTLLLIFGAYIPVISAVRGFIGFDFSYLPALMFFGFGILTGAAVVVRGIKICLEKYRPQMVYAILGMMAGSFYAIIQGPTTLEVPRAAMSFGSFQITASLVGVLLVLGMQILKEKNEKKE